MPKSLFLLFFTIGLSNASAEELDIDNLSLEDLINVKASVASKTEKNTRQSPGIVTVFTKDEIKKMGARDLIDVLTMIPGFNFAYDVQGVVGLAMRGNWAHEGKFSLLIDGQEMNELMYSSTQFGNHYPIDHIKQIEIIRGPGSAIYGGFAELAVIHVITEKGTDLNGARATLTYGQMREDYGRRNMSLQIGKKIGDWDVSIASLVGEGRRGDGSFTGYDINTPAANQSEVYDFSQGKANDLNPNWFNVGISDGKLDFRFIYDNFKTTTREIFGYTGLAEGLRTDFESIYASLKYDFRVSESLTITPYLIYKDQSPWRLTDQNSIPAGSEIFDANVNRLRAGISSLYNLTEKINLLVGAEIYKDKAKAHNWTADLVTPENFAMTGTQKIDFDGAAAYSQLAVDFDAFEVTLGARFEQLSAPQNRKVSKTVPRLAITKASDTWHVKGLASQAYRVPSLFNFDVDFEINGASLIQPETTTTFEAEAGIAVTNKSYLTMNIFSIQIKDPIIYDSNGGESYTNFPQVETQGLEMDYRYKSSWGFSNLSYSYYQKGTNQVVDYTVPDSKELLGIPQHKFTILSSWKSGLGNLLVNPSLVYMSSKHTYAYDVANDIEILQKLPAVTLVNIYFSYPDLIFKGLEMGFGVFNLFDEENRFVQPYKGGIGSVPAPSRELLARLNYTLTF